MVQFVNTDLIQNKYRINVSKYFNLLFVIYIGLSYFETYLTKFIGSNTKFYVLFLIFLLLWNYHFRIVFNKYSFLLLGWFVFKFFSLLWSNFSNNDFNIHFLSQVGFVALFLVLNGRQFSNDFVRIFVKSNYVFSFAFGILSILFNAPFKSEIFASRKVLTLFGLQNDPNNCAAFLIIAIAIAMYTIVFEKKYYILNLIVIGVNSFAILLTSSRAGFISIPLLLVLILFVPSQKKYDLIGKFKILIIILLVILLGYLLIVNFLPFENIERIFSFSDYKGGSGRSERWSLAYALIIERPFFGWGWSGYNIGFGAIHNTLLTSLCDVGLVGTSIILIFIFTIFIESFKKKNSLAIILLFCGLFPALMIDAINKRFFWNSIIVAVLLIQKSKIYKSFKIWN